MDGPLEWVAIDQAEPSRDCSNLHQWQAGTFVLKIRECTTSPWYPYTPQDDGA